MTIDTGNADFFVAPTHSAGVTAFIALNDKAEAFCHKHNINGNVTRTAFGLTIYAHGDEERRSISVRIAQADMQKVYAHL